MKKFYVCLTFLLFFGWGINNANAQYLRVKFQDGTEETQEISLLQDLQFPDNLLQITFLSGSVESYNLSLISTLYLQLYPTAITDFSLNNEQKISIYPNPASDVIYIKTAQEITSVVSIYRVDGVLVFQNQVSSENKSIDISSLTSGLYLLRVNNQAIKFLKQ